MWMESAEGHLGGAVKAKRPKPEAASEENVARLFAYFETDEELLRAPHAESRL